MTFDIEKAMGALQAQYASVRKLQESGRRDEAAAAYDEAIDTHYQIAVALQRAGNFEASRNAYLSLIGAGAMLGAALHDLGYLAYLQADFVKAEAYSLAAHAIDPASVFTLNNLAASCKQLGKFEACLEASEKALLIDPDNAIALNCKGAALFGMHRYDEALPVYRKVVDLAPDLIEGGVNLAATLKSAGKLDEALLAYQRVLMKNPGHALANFNYATALLKAGNYARGFELFEWRWESVLSHSRREFGKPLWLGDTPLQGQTILLYQEQGIGDGIQFCRYIPKIVELGADIILVVDDALVRLLRDQWINVRVIGKSMPMPGDFDCHCPLMSLPFAFKTDLQTIPSSRSYLQTDPELESEWAKRIDADTKIRIGVAWSGRAEYITDALRSLRLSEFPEFDADRYEIFSLQKEVRDVDANELRRRGYRHFGEFLVDFADTAALISSMDLVISVDTSVAHLAASLGKPVWILLSTNSDWRWLSGRVDSPWYPTVRLFRQERQGEWSTVFSHIQEALKAGV